MNLTKSLRAKYDMRETRSGQLRHSPGGRDILLLCNACDALEALVRSVQHALPTSEQNRVERELWTIDRG